MSASEAGTEYSLIVSSVCLGDAWVPYGLIVAVMRWFGKAPVVHVDRRETLFRELREIGFVDVTDRDVGAFFWSFPGGLPAGMATSWPIPPGSLPPTRTSSPYPTMCGRRSSPARS